MQPDSKIALEELVPWLCDNCESILFLPFYGEPRTECSCGMGVWVEASLCEGCWDYFPKSEFDFCHRCLKEKS